MNSSTDKIRWAIFDAVADDYESIDTIIASVQSEVPEADLQKIELESGPVMGACSL